MMEFSELVKKAGLTKQGLASRLGLAKNTPSNWGESPPHYAVAYLKLLTNHFPDKDNPKLLWLIKGECEEYVLTKDWDMGTAIFRKVVTK